jgi:hypothetical protein
MVPGIHFHAAGGSERFQMLSACQSLPGRDGPTGLLAVSFNAARLRGFSMPPPPASFPAPSAAASPGPQS